MPPAFRHHRTQTDPEFEVARGSQNREGQLREDIFLKMHFGFGRCGAYADTKRPRPDARAPGGTAGRQPNLS